MNAKLLIDLSDKLRKGDAPPKGHEARYVRAGLAKEVKAKSASSKKSEAARTTTSDTSSANEAEGD